jgi:hypothetical protein
MMLVGIIGHVFAQSQAYSPILSFHIAREMKPPLLTIVDGPHFGDADTNDCIDANDECWFRMTIQNNGEGECSRPTARIKAEGTTVGIHYDTVKSLRNIPVGDTVQVEYLIHTDASTANGNVIFTVWVDEPYKQRGTAKEQLNIRTREFQKPKIMVMDYSVEEKGTGYNVKILEKGKKYSLTGLVQNVGEGAAENVLVSFNNREGVIQGSNGISWAKLPSGGSQETTITVVVPETFEKAELKLNVQFLGSCHEYAQDTIIVLPINQTKNMPKEVIPKLPQNKFELATLYSSVDTDIPTNNEQHSNRHALIIGNQNYDKQRMNKVLFAIHDAEIFEEYCTSILGIPQRQIILLRDAKKDEMQKGISDFIRLVSCYPYKDAEIVFYYAGHGLPNRDSIPCLIPVDGNANTIDQAFPIYGVFDSLLKNEPQLVTVFLDACYTGAGRNKKDELAFRAPIPITEPKKNELFGNIVVFSATSADENAWAYEDKKHGMFTYFLLQKLNETNGTCSYKELFQYLHQEVGLRSLEEHETRQTPEVRTGPFLEDIWEELRFIDVKDKD